MPSGIPRNPEDGDRIILELERLALIINGPNKNELVYIEPILSIRQSSIKTRAVALVDLGAHYSIMGPELYTYLNKIHSLRLEKTDEAPTAMNGNEVPFSGVCRISVTVMDKIVTHDVFVTVSWIFAFQLVMGIDLIDKFKFIINRDTKKLFMQDTEVPYATRPFVIREADITALNDAVIRPPEVNLHKCVTIPPREKAFCLGLINNINKNTEQCALMLFEPNTQFNLQVEPTLVTISDDSLIPVVIANTTDKPLKISKNTNVGNLTNINQLPEPVETDILASLIQPETKTELTLHEFRLEHITNDAQKQNLIDLFRSYANVFATSDSDIGRTTLAEHNIDTGDASPIYQKQYRIAYNDISEIDRQVGTMHAKGIVEDANSPWNSPIILVEKKDGSRRLVVDFRKINSVTRRDRYPIPNITETLDNLGNAKFFSTLDLAAGYWQMGLKREDREKTAFSTPKGQYQFTVLPFGVCNGPSSFQRLMNAMLRGILYTFCLVYLDDIIVYSDSFSKHLEHLRTVFERLKIANLKLKIKKCNFLQSEVKYLGHIVSPLGVSPDPENISVLRNLKRPTSISEIQQFMGLAGYYRRFIENFAEKALPLTKLTRKNQPYEWNQSQEEAFRFFTNCLTTQPILQYPDFSKDFILATDASQYAIGAVLGQNINNQETVVAYASRVLQPAEVNYMTTEKEALAVYWGIKHFHPYLYGRHFRLVVDHNAIQWLQECKDKVPKLIRWSMKIDSYSFTIEYKRGKLHTNADAMSRLPLQMALITKPETHKIPPTPHPFNIEWRTAQNADPQLASIIAYLTTNCTPPHPLPSWWHERDNFTLHGKLLFRILHERPNSTNRELKFQLMVPQNKIPDVLFENHDHIFGGHLGVEKTYFKIRDQYFWEKMYTTVKNYCLSCDICNRRTSQGGSKAPMGLYQIPGKPFERVHIDVLGPFPTTDRGNKYLVVFICAFTKWPEAFAVPNQQAKTIADLLVNKFICRFSPPNTLISDRGTNFLSLIVKEVCEYFAIHKKQTTSYNPKCNGAVERHNRVLLDGLAKFCQKNPYIWDTCVDGVLYSYRTARQSSTKETPFKLLYGRRPNTQSSSFSPDGIPHISQSDYTKNLVEQFRETAGFVKEQLKIAQEKQAEQYNKSTNAKQFEVNDLVYLHNPVIIKGHGSKLRSDLWVGPHRVVEVISPLNYRIQDTLTKKIQVVNTNRLKHALIDQETTVETGTQQNASHIESEPKYESNESNNVNQLQTKTVEHLPINKTTNDHTNTSENTSQREPNNPNENTNNQETNSIESENMVTQNNTEQTSERGGGNRVIGNRVCFEDSDFTAILSELENSVLQYNSSYEIDRTEPIDDSEQIETPIKIKGAGKYSEIYSDSDDEDDDPPADITRRSTRTSRPPDRYSPSDF